MLGRTRGYLKTKAERPRLLLSASSRGAVKSQRKPFLVSVLNAMSFLEEYNAAELDAVQCLIQLRDSRGAVLVPFNTSSSSAENRRGEEGGSSGETGRRRVARPAAGDGGGSMSDLTIEKIHRCWFVGCDKAYGKSSHLKAHVRTHTGSNFPLFFVCS